MRKTVAQLTAELEQLYVRVQALEAENCSLRETERGLTQSLRAAHTELDTANDTIHRMKEDLLIGKLTVRPEVKPHRIVTMGGRQYAKVPSLQGGRTIFTYKPLEA